MPVATTIASTSLVALNGEVPSDEPGWHQLVRWHGVHEEIAFLYSRSLGGLMETGRGHIAKLNPTLLTLESGECALLITLTGAAYKLGPQLFFSSNLLRRFNVEGVAVSLANCDWLFITAEASPSTLSLRTP